MLGTWSAPAGPAAWTRPGDITRSTGDATEVVVVHVELADARARTAHEKEWATILELLDRALDEDEG